MDFQPLRGRTQSACLAFARSTFLLCAFILKSPHQMFMSSSGDKKKSVQEKKLSSTSHKATACSGGCWGVCVCGGGDGWMQRRSAAASRSQERSRRATFTFQQPGGAASSRPPTKYREGSLSDGLPGLSGGLTRTLSTPSSHRLHAQPAHPCKFQQTDESCEQTGSDQISGFITLNKFPPLGNFHLRPTGDFLRLRSASAPSKAPVWLWKSA